jgi:hypothetical protein
MITAAATGWQAVPGPHPLERNQAGGYEALLWPADDGGCMWIVFHVLGAFVAGRGHDADPATARAQAESALTDAPIAAAARRVRRILRTAGHSELADEGTGATWRITRPDWHVFPFNGKIRVAWWSDKTLHPTLPSTGRTSCTWPPSGPRWRPLA